MPPGSPRKAYNMFDTSMEAHAHALMSLTSYEALILAHSMNGVVSWRWL